MSKHRPDPEKLANELAGASAFFRRPNPADPQPASATDANRTTPSAPTPSLRPADSAPTSAPVRDGRPVRRTMIRHPFELYADQLDRLRELADQQKRRGEPGSMSAMVRDAIDRLLDEQLP